MIAGVTDSSSAKGPAYWCWKIWSMRRSSNWIGVCEETALTHLAVTRMRVAVTHRVSYRPRISSRQGHSADLSREKRLWAIISNRGSLGKTRNLIRSDRTVLRPHRRSLPAGPGRTVSSTDIGHTHNLNRLYRQGPGRYSDWARYNCPRHLYCRTSSCLPRGIRRPSGSPSDYRHCTVGSRSGGSCFQRE